MPDANTDAISTEVHSGALLVRFTRPDLRNALSISVLASLDRVVGHLELDDLIDRVVFTGTDGVFASGADLREIASLDANDAREFAMRGQKLMNAIASLRQTTIAVVNGYCFGGALDLALACDRRIAAPNAKFAHPGSGLGIITGWGGTQRLTRLIGRANSLEIFFTASPIDAGRALRIGLVDEIADDPLGNILLG